MAQWGWPETSVWVDPDDGNIKLAGEVMVNASVVRNELVVTYEEGWDTYFTNPSFPQVQELLKLQQSKLTKGSGKGKDKGNKGQQWAGKGERTIS